MKPIIAIINVYTKFDTVFEPIAGEMGMAVKKYTGIKSMVNDLNTKVLPAEDLALIIVTGTSEENDAAQYKRNMNLLLQLSKHSKLKSVPVLFMGYKGDNYLPETCTGFGAEYLDLPVRKSELMERIRVLCGQSEPITIGQEGAESQGPPITIGQNDQKTGSEQREKPAPITIGEAESAIKPITIGPEEAKIDVPPITIGQNDQKTGSEQKEKPAPITIGEGIIAIEPITIGPEEAKSELPPITIGPKAKKQGSEQPKKSSAEAERRLATVMFADISGFTTMSEKMDPEEVTRVMNGVFREMESVIREHGGTIDKFIGDCVMVLFGVPKALENAPNMAVNTAIRMRNALYRFNEEMNLAIPLDIHIGMNTGPVVAGHVGGIDRKDYTVMGDAVNLASRIEGVSEKGQILVGPETYHATNGDFEYRPLAPVTLKGKADPVPVYELLSVKEKTARRKRGQKPQDKTGPDRMIFSELVGRDEEMNELRHAVTGLIKGRGGIVNVIGEAGIGKSRLMAELKGDPAMKKVLLLEGQAVSMGRNLSFHPVIDLLRNWAGIREDDSGSESFGKLDRAVRVVHPTEADEIVSFVATLMGMKLSDKYAERVRGIEGEALEKLIFKNLRELLVRGSGQRPMVIRFEDLHWADTSSIELISSLFKLAKENRILFLNFFRPNYDETGDRVAKTAKEELVDIYTEINIRPLDEDESGTLISNLLNIRGIPQSLKEQITERAGGNPFFIEEVVRSFIDDGAVVKKGDSFAVTEKIHDVKVPLTINEVLMSRIDRLDEDTKNLVKTASVIGRYFFYKIIASVAENVSDIDRRLSYLEDIQLIRERKRMDELEFLFKHALAQEAAYESILIQKRKELHLHVAQTIENVFNERLHEFYGMLAYHYSKGDNLEKSEEYMLKAGEEAMKASASSEALDYYREALGLYKERCGSSADKSKIAMLEKNIAIAHYNRGEYAKSQEYFDRALPYYGIKTPGNAVAALYKIFEGLFHFIIGLYIPSVKWKVNPTPEFRESIILYHLKTSSLLNIDARKWFMNAFYPMKLFTKMDIPSMKDGAGLLAGYSIMFSASGISFALSRKILDFLSDKVSHDEKKSVLYYETYALWHDLGSGDRIQHPGYDDELLDWNIKNGEFLITIVYIGGFFLIDIEKGNTDNIQRYAEKLKVISSMYGNDYASAIYFEDYTRWLTKIRKWNEALDVSKHGIDYTSKKGYGLMTLALHSCRAQMHAMRNENQEAELEIKEAGKIVSRMNASPMYLSTYYLSQCVVNLSCLETMIASEESGISAIKKKALDAAKKAVALSQKYSLNRTEALKLMGTCCWLLVKPVQALRWWKKSIAEGVRLGATLELSRTYFEVGKRLRIPSPAGKGFSGDDMAKKIIGLTPAECLDKAGAMFRDMDLQWDLEQMEKLKQIELLKM